MDYQRTMTFLMMLAVNLALNGRGSNVASKVELGCAESVKTIYGEFVITEPILIELLASKAMQRLKKVHQLGISRYVQKTTPYSRYDHSVGVFVLLRRFNQSLAEQIAGLLHDVSHTVFSHVADYLFTSKEMENSYQDGIHKWFLEKTDIMPIIAKYGYCLDDFMHKNGKFVALEQDLPNLCADRIEYTLYEYAIDIGLENTLAVHTQIEYLLKHLHFENGVWFFDQIDAARTYARLSLGFTKDHWASAFGMYTYTMAARTLQRALDIKLIDYDTIHFGTDDDVWETLKASSDTQIRHNLDKICYNGRAYRLGSSNNYDMHLKAKFRGVDPFVATPQGLERLSKLDCAFAKEFTTLKEQILEGVYIKDLL